MSLLKEFKFLKLKTFKQVEEIIEKFSCIKTEQIEEISIYQSNGRILAEDIISNIDYPTFRRALVDGYAVCAKETFGAPQYLKIIGEIKMGTSADKLKLEKESAFKIHTGGMLPCGADAVVMLEDVEELEDNIIEVKKAIAVGENIINIGDDIKAKELVMCRGKKLNPKDLGILFALSIPRIKVYKPLIIVTIATGDELVPLCSFPPPPGKIINSNIPCLIADMQKEGFIVHDLGIVRDNPQELKEALKKADELADVIIISGSSSVGSRDYLTEVVDEVLVHGITIKPGKPTLLAKFSNKLVIGLPGHPTSCLLVYNLIAKPLLFRLAGTQYNNLTVIATITEKVSSQVGRRDFIRVKLKKQGKKIFAEPLLQPSAMLASLTATDGFFIIPEEKDGVLANEEGEVLLI